MSYKILISKLGEFASPNFNSDNNLLKDNLSIILQSLIKFCKKNFIEQSLFNQILFTGAELYLLLEQMEKQNYDEKFFTNYLNVLEKFTGSITSKYKKDVLSESLFRSLAEKRHEIYTLQRLKNLNFSDDQKFYLINAFKPNRFIINSENKSHWENFCINICQNEKDAMALGSLVKKLVENNIHAEWINSSFIHYILLEGDYSSKERFDFIIEELNNALFESKYLNKISQLICLLELKIDEWKFPKNFKNLFENFKIIFSEINKTLEYDENFSHLTHNLILQNCTNLIDVLDRTLKSLGKSIFYNDKQVHITNFKLVLDEFYLLMRKWAKYAAFNKGDEALIAIDNIYSSKNPPFNEQALSPSSNFSVNMATIDRLENLLGHNVNEYRNRFLGSCQSLEDFFTLFHQNLLVSIGYLALSNNNLYLDNAPSFLKELLRYVNNISNSESAINFVSSEIMHPFIELDYNIPVRYHSAKLVLKFNYTLNRANLKFYMVGHNGGHRWDNSEFYSYVNFLAYSNIVIVQAPHHNLQKSTFTFEVEFNKISSFKKLIKLINQEIHYSMNYEMRHPLLNIYTFKNSLSKVSDNNLKLLFKYLESLLYEKPFLRSSLDFILTGIIEIAINKLKNFNINYFITNHATILSDKVFINLWKKLISYTSLIDKNYRENPFSFSIFELMIKNDHTLIKDIIANDYIDYTPNLLRIILSIKIENDQTNKKFDEILNIGKYLVQEKGIKLIINFKDDWLDVRDNVKRDKNNFFLKNCDLNSVYIILYTEIHILLPRIMAQSHTGYWKRKCMQLSTTYTDNLAQENSIVITSPEFHEKMLDIAVTIPDNDNTINKIKTDLENVSSLAL